MLWLYFKKYIDFLAVNCFFCFVFWELSVTYSIHYLNDCLSNNRVVSANCCSTPTHCQSLRCRIIATNHQNCSLDHLLTWARCARKGKLSHRSQHKSPSFCLHHKTRSHVPFSWSQTYLCIEPKHAGNTGPSLALQLWTTDININLPSIAQLFSLLLILIQQTSHILTFWMARFACIECCTLFLCETLYSWREKEVKRPKAGGANEEEEAKCKCFVQTQRPGFRHQWQLSVNLKLHLKNELLPK